MATAAPPLAWAPWSTAAFARAGAENRPVLLCLVTRWSAACAHVERDVLNAAPVDSLLRDRFVPVGKRLKSSGSGRGWWGSQVQSLSRPPSAAKVLASQACFRPAFPGGAGLGRRVPAPRPAARYTPAQAPSPKLRRPSV